MSWSTDEPRRPGEFRLGTIAGVPVLVRISWLLIAALIAVLLAPEIRRVAPGLGAGTYLAGLAFAVLLYLSVLVHELAHALVALRFGLRVSAIRLEFLGGVTEIRGQARTPWQEFATAIVGPLASIAVGLVALLGVLAEPPGLIGLAVRGLAYANLFVGLFNLLPGLPLDGGRVLGAGVWKLTGSANTGSVVSAWGGRLLAVLIIAVPVLLTLAGRHVATSDFLIAAMVALFVWGGASAALAMARIRRRLPRIEARALARPATLLPAGLSLAEGIRQAQEAGADDIVTTEGGEIAGIVHGAAVVAVPEDRRPWVTLGSVSRPLRDDLSLPVDIPGEELLATIARSPAAEYLLMGADGSVAGVLRLSDVEARLAR